MKTLILQAKNGCSDARRRLVAELQPRLESMARYYGRCCCEEPEDLLGEAWTAVFEALQITNIEIGKPEQYLLKRARWRMLDYIKWARRRRCDENDEDTPGCPVGDFSSEVVTTTVIAQISDDLTSVQRSILDGLMEGQTWREVAADLGCSSANVAYHVRQIRQRCASVVEAVAQVPE